MKFELTPGSRCRVKILEEVPNFRIARLEGRNGIGKTMAVRLLQLCTGDQPYRASEKAVWSELKKALGSVSIRCSDLDGATSVEWEIDASLWPEEPIRTFDLIGHNDHPGICKAVTIDGQPADLQAVRELLQVHRLAGDETLAEAILADVSDLKAIAESERALADLHRGRVATVLETFDELLEAAAPQTLQNAVEALKESGEKRDEVKKHLAKTIKRHEELKEFALRRAELSSLLEKHGDPEAHADRLEEELEDLRKQQDALRKERDSLNLDVGRNEQTLKEIDQTEGKLEAARRERDKLLAEGHELAVQLGLVSLPAGPKEPAILTPQRKTEERLSSAREAQAAIDSAPQVVALGDRVLGLLSDGAVSSIRGRPIATLSEDQRKLSAADLEAGIEARQSEIANEGRPPQAEQLAEEIQQLEKDLESFGSLASVVRRIKLRDTKIARGRETLGELAEKLPGTQGQRFAELEAKQQELAQQATDLDAERMRILQQMQQIARGESTGTLLERLERSIASAGTTMEGLDSDITDKGREVILLTKELEECELLVEQGGTALTAAKAAQQDALTQLATSSQWKALRDRDLLPASALDLDENQRRVDKLARAGKKSEERLDAVSSLVQDRILAGVVAADQRKTPDSESARKVLGLLEERLGRDYFAHPSVEEALFGGGELRRFDLIDQIVEWQPKAEEPVSRHLEAFSSGERAFAYTKTRLERLRDKPLTRNRFVALDEFGAFLERSRLELLEDYLAYDVVGKFVNQALIVLPLSVSRDVQNEPFVFKLYGS